MTNHEAVRCHLSTSRSCDFRKRGTCCSIDLAFKTFLSAAPATAAVKYSRRSVKVLVCAFVNLSLLHVDATLRKRRRVAAHCLSKLQAGLAILKPFFWQRKTNQVCDQSMQYLITKHVLCIGNLLAEKRETTL